MCKYSTFNEAAMSSLQCLRGLITERLTAAAEEIFRHVEKTIIEYEEEVDRQRKLLDIVRKPRLKLQQIEDEVLTEQQLGNQERNQEEPESKQIKEEQEEVCISPEEEQLEVKQEADTLIPILDNEKRYHMEPEPDSDLQLLSHTSVAESQDQTGSDHVVKNVEHEEDVDFQHRLFHMKWSPVIKLHRTDLPQQHVCKEEEVLKEQQLGNQEKDSGLDQEEPESLQMKEGQGEICTSHEVEQLEVKQEADTVMLTADNEESDRKYKVDCHTDKRSFKLDTSRLVAHKRVHTVEKPFSCRTCAKCFRTKFELLLHLRMHTGEKPYSCKICGKCFKQSSNLLKHNRTHTGEKPYSCRICGKCFRQYSHLITHEKTHTVEKPYSCDTFGKCSEENLDLVCHERTHTFNKLYTCETCGKYFRQSSNLTKHKRTHSGETPYSCETCGKCFSQSSNFIKHKRTHTGEQPYSCEICGKSFSQSSNFIKHKRTHTGEKPYTCKICGKSFTQSSNLRVHERTHTVEKTYSCKTCGKCFTQRSNLTIHQRSHTGENHTTATPVEGHLARGPV